MIITPVHRRPGESSGMAVVHRTGYWGSPTFCCHFIIMTTLTIIIIIVIILIIIISIDVIKIIIIIIRLLWLYYHHPIISIYHQCHHQTGPGSWLSPRSSLWHIINDQSINDWQYYCWANELWLSSSLPILVLSSLFSFSWAELRPLSSSCLKRWCVLPTRSLRTFALPDNQPLWQIHVTTVHHLTIGQGSQGGLGLGEERAPPVLVSQVVQARVEVLLVVVVPGGRRQCRLISGANFFIRYLKTFLVSQLSLWKVRWHQSHHPHRNILTPNQSSSSLNCQITWV